MVLTGRLEPGDRINEVAIAEDLGISRGPLREAIQGLASEGLLSVVPHRGAFVRTITTGDLRDLYELRIAVESYAVRLGVIRGTDTQYAALKRALEQVREELEGTVSAHYPSDLDVHDLLVQLANNDALLQAMRDTHVRIRLARARSAFAPERARQAHVEHERIVAAICAGNGDEAASLLEEHLREALDNALLLLQSS